MTLLICMSFCGNKQKIYKVAKISYAIEVDENNYFSEESNIEICGNFYSLRRELEYDENGNAVQLRRYYPEGIIEYSRDEILKDTKLLELYNWPIKQLWIYYPNKGLMLDNGILEVEVLDNNIIKQKEKGEVTLYYLVPINND
jgi:hypothetical protein